MQRSRPWAGNGCATASSCAEISKRFVFAWGRPKVPKNVLTYDCEEAARPFIWSAMRVVARFLHRWIRFVSMTSADVWLDGKLIGKTRSGPVAEWVASRLSPHSLPGDQPQRPACAESGRDISQAPACSGLRLLWPAPGENGIGTTDLGRVLQTACQLRHLLQCLHTVRIVRAC